MSKLIVLVGLPGSGKSTLAQKLKIEYKAEIISSDALKMYTLFSGNEINGFKSSTVNQS